MAAPDLVIVGAGIVGAACAWEAARAGLQVTLLDREPVGSGTTAAGMGHLVVMDDSEAQFALTALSVRLWSELAPELPPTVEYERCGTLWVAADGEEFAEVQRKAAWYAERGVAAEVLDAAALAAAEPCLRAGLAGGLRVPHDAVVYPPTAARWLADRAVALGATLLHHAAATSVEPGCVTLAGGARVSAGRVVIAAGSASPRLVPGIVIQPRKGHLAITDRYPGFVRHQLVELGYLHSAHASDADSVAFNLQPRATGQVLIGSSRQYGATDLEAEPAMLRRMLARAVAYVPRLAALNITRVWCGQRPATPDKLPLIGPSPAHDRVWLAAGHEGLGITTALGTARLLVDQVLGRTSPIPVEPYLPARLSGASHGQ